MGTALLIKRADKNRSPGKMAQFAASPPDRKRCANRKGSRPLPTAIGGERLAFMRQKAGQNTK